MCVERLEHVCVGGLCSVARYCEFKLYFNLWITQCNFSSSFLHWTREDIVARCTLCFAHDAWCTKISSHKQAMHKQTTMQNDLGFWNGTPLSPPSTTFLCNLTLGVSLWRKAVSLGTQSMFKLSWSVKSNSLLLLYLRSSVILHF